MNQIHQDEELVLLCRTAAVLCALPLKFVSETMRPLAITAFYGSPWFVPGLAVIRGIPVPVVDMGLLLGHKHSNPMRFVTVNAENHTVALAVDQIAGIRRIRKKSLQGLPPLLRDDASAVDVMGSLDGELLLVLRSALIVPDSVWTAIKAAGS